LVDNPTKNIHAKASDYTISFPHYQHSSHFCAAQEDHASRRHQERKQDAYMKPGACILVGTVGTKHGDESDDFTLAHQLP
jgi:hypothetical protein